MLSKRPSLSHPFMFLFHFISIDYLMGLLEMGIDSKVIGLRGQAVYGAPHLLKTLLLLQHAEHVEPPSPSAQNTVQDISASGTTDDL